MHARSESFFGEGLQVLRTGGGGIADHLDTIRQEFARVDHRVEHHAEAADAAGERASFEGLDFLVNIRFGDIDLELRAVAGGEPDPAEQVRLPDARIVEIDVPDEGPLGIFGATIGQTAVEKVFQQGVNLVRVITIVLVVHEQVLQSEHDERVVIVVLVELGAEGVVGGAGLGPEEPVGITFVGQNLGLGGERTHVVADLGPVEGNLVCPGIDIGGLDGNQERLPVGRILTIHEGNKQQPDVLSGGGGGQRSGGASADRRGRVAGLGGGGRDGKSHPEVESGHVRIDPGQGSGRAIGVRRDVVQPGRVVDFHERRFGVTRFVRGIRKDIEVEVAAAFVVAGSFPGMHEGIHEAAAGRTGGDEHELVPRPEDAVPFLENEPRPAGGVGFVEAGIHGDVVESEVGQVFPRRVCAAVDGVVGERGRNRLEHFTGIGQGGGGPDADGVLGVGVKQTVDRKQLVAGAGPVAEITQALLQAGGAFVVVAGSLRGHGMRAGQAVLVLRQGETGENRNGQGAVGVVESGGGESDTDETLETAARHIDIAGQTIENGRGEEENAGSSEGCIAQQVVENQEDLGSGGGVGEGERTAGRVGKIPGRGGQGQEAGGIAVFDFEGDRTDDKSRVVAIESGEIDQLFQVDLRDIPGAHGGRENDVVEQHGAGGIGLDGEGEQPGGPAQMAGQIGDHLLSRCADIIDDKLPDQGIGIGRSPEVDAQQIVIGEVARALDVEGDGAGGGRDVEVVVGAAWRVLVQFEIEVGDGSDDVAEGQENGRGTQRARHFAGAAASVVRPTRHDIVVGDEEVVAAAITEEIPVGDGERRNHRRPAGEGNVAGGQPECGQAGRIRQTGGAVHQLDRRMLVGRAVERAPVDGRAVTGVENRIRTGGVEGGGGRRVLVRNLAVLDDPVVVGIDILAAHAEPRPGRPPIIKERVVAGDRFQVFLGPDQGMRSDFPVENRGQVDIMGTGNGTPLGEGIGLEIRIGEKHVVPDGRAVAAGGKPKWLAEGVEFLVTVLRNDIADVHLVRQVGIDHIREDVGFQCRDIEVGHQVFLIEVMWIEIGDMIDHHVESRHPFDRFGSHGGAEGMGDEMVFEGVRQSGLGHEQSETNEQVEQRVPRRPAPSGRNLVGFRSPVEKDDHFKRAVGSIRGQTAIEEDRLFGIDFSGQALVEDVVVEQPSGSEVVDAGGQRAERVAGRGPASGQRVEIAVAVEILGRALQVTEDRVLAIVELETVGHHRHPANLVEMRAEIGSGRFHGDHAQRSRGPVAGIRIIINGESVEPVEHVGGRALFDQFETGSQSEKRLRGINNRGCPGKHDPDTEGHTGVRFADDHRGLSLGIPFQTQ